MSGALNKIKTQDKQIEELQRAIAEKNKAIAKKDQLIAKNAKVIAEKDLALAKKDQAIAEKDEEIHKLRVSAIKGQRVKRKQDDGIGNAKKRKSTSKKKQNPTYLIKIAKRMCYMYLKKLSTR